MRQITNEYGRAIKHRMIDLGLTEAALAVLVAEKSGMYCDQPLINKLISGQINPSRRPKLAQAINDCLNIVAQ